MKLLNHRIIGLYRGYVSRLVGEKDNRMGYCHGSNPGYPNTSYDMERRFIIECWNSFQSSSSIRLSTVWCGLDRNSKYTDSGGNDSGTIKAEGK
ncbi:MAG: hypothetical protein ACPGSG_08310 [Prolixibacteraceae bacterium]